MLGSINITAVIPTLQLGNATTHRHLPHEIPRVRQRISIAVLFVSMLGFVPLHDRFAFADDAKQNAEPSLSSPIADGSIRIATFNASLYRKNSGELAVDLAKENEPQATRIAKIISIVDPDILFINEIDDDNGTSAKLLMDKYLNPSRPIERQFKYIYSPPVNTGVDSQLDLDLNGKIGGAGDAWGYGVYPGQYGMSIFSRFPIINEEIRTFQKLPWSSMPDARRPVNVDGTNYFPDAIWSAVRLSSKTHCDVPIDVLGTKIHLLGSHPTPPVFDGAEDRNGCRNADEISLWRHYIEGGASGEYLVDDKGTKGPIAKDAAFVILGDLNADPIDGSGIHESIEQLVSSKKLADVSPPSSQGAVESAKVQGRLNATHNGDPANDTGDFNDGNPGNLRCDFMLPSTQLKITQSGVFWPTKEELSSVDKDLLEASDHRLVWIDIQIATH